MNQHRPNTLRRFFAGIAEYTFQSRLGVADPPLVDYVTDMLVRFVRFENTVKVRDLRGRPLTQVAEMLYEAQQRTGDARREVHRHIGDYTLFWTGVYPESLGKKQSNLNADQLVDYRQQGKRAYWIASTIETESSEQSAPSDVLERLSRRFELCAYGLREIRRDWETRDGGGPLPFLLG